MFSEMRVEGLNRVQLQVYTVESPTTALRYFADIPSHVQLGWGLPDEQGVRIVTVSWTRDTGNDVITRERVMDFLKNIEVKLHD